MKSIFFGLLIIPVSLTLGVKAGTVESLGQSGEKVFAKAADKLAVIKSDVPAVPKPKTRRPKRQYDYPLENYAVEYILRGELETGGENGLALKTADGRSFDLLTADSSLDSQLKKIADGQKFAQVEGNALRVDELGAIRVDAVLPISRQKAVMKEPAYPSFQRPAKLLSASDSAVTVGNVRWGVKPAQFPGQNEYNWENAVIRPELVDKVYLIKKPFHPERFAAHSLMLFTFKNGGFTTIDGKEAKAFVLSVEAVKPPLQTMDFFISSINREFPIVWIFSTGEDYLRLACSGDNAKLFVHEINLDQDQKVNLLKEAVKLASVNRVGEYYNLFTNNCTITLVVLLNRVLYENQKIALWASKDLLNPEVNLPNIAFEAFEKKGLLSPTVIQIDKSNYRDLIRKFHEDVNHPAQK